MLENFTLIIFSMLLVFVPMGWLFSRLWPDADPEEERRSQGLPLELTAEQKQMLGIR